MSALDRLKEKVEAWKQRIDELEQENLDLRTQLEQFSQAEDEETGDLSEALVTCQETVTALEKEMEEKDQEIEAIIARVEAMIA